MDLEGASEHIAESAVLILAGQTIHTETVPSPPLYRLSRDVTSTPSNQKAQLSSVIFECIEHTDGATEQLQAKHIFYLVHPTGAQYRTDIPAAYYMTSTSPEMPGNVRFEICKSRLQRKEFKALLSPNRTASDTPLFDGDQRLLFTVKSRWGVRPRYTWSSDDGNPVAVEEKKGEQDRLVVTVPMESGMMHALVALWALRLWHDTAESRRAKREELERLTPAMPPSEYDNYKLAKRAGALGGIAGGSC